MKGNLGMRILVGIVAMIIMMALNNAAAPHCDRCHDKISGVVYRDKENHKDYCSDCYSYYRRVGVYW